MKYNTVNFSTLLKFKKLRNMRKLANQNKHGKIKVANFPFFHVDFELGAICKEVKEIK